MENYYQVTLGMGAVTARKLQLWNEIINKLVTRD